MASINIGTNAVFSGHLESVLFVVGTSSHIDPCNKHNAQYHPEVGQRYQQYATSTLLHIPSLNRTVAITTDHLRNMLFECIVVNY